MTAVRASPSAAIVREIDPSRRADGPDASPGVIAEAEKPEARRELGRLIAHFEPIAGTSRDLRVHLERLRHVQAQLELPRDFDARSGTYRRAQEAGLPVTELDGRASDYHLSPAELEAGVERSVRRAADLDASLQAARQRGPDAANNVEVLGTHLRAAIDQTVRMRQQSVLAQVDALELSAGTPVDVSSVEGLLALREHVDAQVGRWSRRDDPEVRSLIATDPHAIVERRQALEALRSSISMTIGGEHAHAQALFDATWGRSLGNHEQRAQLALAQMHLAGTKELANAELQRLMAMHGIEAPEGGDFSAIRHTIATRMSFVDREVAERMFATGHDDRSTSQWRYLAHSLMKPFDAVFDWAVDNPGAATGVAGGGVLAAATLPASLLAAAGLGFGLYETSGGVYDYITASNRDETVDAIYRLGGGVTTTAAGALAARPMLSAIGCARSVAGEPALPNGVDPRNFLHRGYSRVMGSLVKGQDVGRSWELEAAERPRFIYRAAYYAPNGRRMEYATTSEDAANAFARSHPGMLVYTGQRVDDSVAWGLEAGPLRPPGSVFARGYSWTDARPPRPR